VGRQDAAVKAQQEMQVQAYMDEALNWTRNALIGGIKVNRGIDHLQEVQIKAPGNTVMAHAVASLVSQR